MLNHKACNSGLRLGVKIFPCGNYSLTVLHMLLLLSINKSLTTGFAITRSSYTLLTIENISVQGIK
jgi:hypothetical protein